MSKFELEKNVETQRLRLRIYGKTKPYKINGKAKRVGKRRNACVSEFTDKSKASGEGKNEHEKLNMQKPALNLFQWLTRMKVL